MSITSIFKKITNAMSMRGNSGERLTPNEVELKSYERQEYLDNVKARLHEYRKKHSNEMFKSTFAHNSKMFHQEKQHSLNNQPMTILKSKQKREKSLLTKGGLM